MNAIRRFFSRIAAWFRRPESAGASAEATPAETSPAPETKIGNYCELKFWSGEIDKQQQLTLLMSCGVLVWNSRIEAGKEKNERFWPDLSGSDLHELSKSAKSMIWGKPADIVGGERVVLADINLESANLEGVTFAREGAGADLRRALLSRSKLRHAKMPKSNFEGASLEGADLRDADLRHANFSRAVLRNANLLDAKLDGANFAWADLSGAIVSAKALEGANLFGARLSHTSVLGYQPTGLVFGRNLMGRRVKLVPKMGVAWG